MVLVVEPTHPWVFRDKVEPADLPDADWVLRETGSGTRSIFESWLVRIGLSPADLRIALELPSNEAIRSAVEAGAGATVISRLVATGSLRAGSLVEIGLDLPTRRFYALRHKQRYLTHAERAFQTLLAEA